MGTNQHVQHLTGTHGPRTLNFRRYSSPRRSFLPVERNIKCLSSVYLWPYGFLPLSTLSKGVDTVFIVSGSYFCPSIILFVSLPSLHDPSLTLPDRWRGRVWGHSHGEWPTVPRLFCPFILSFGHFTPLPHRHLICYSGYLFPSDSTLVKNTQVRGWLTSTPE